MCIKQTVSETLRKSALEWDQKWGHIGGSGQAWNGAETMTIRRREYDAMREKLFIGPAEWAQTCQLVILKAEYALMIQNLKTLYGDTPAQVRAVAEQPAEVEQPAEPRYTLPVVEHEWLWKARKFLTGIEIAGDGTVTLARQEYLNLWNAFVYATHPPSGLYTPRPPSGKPIAYQSHESEKKLTAAARYQARQRPIDVTAEFESLKVKAEK